MLFYSLGPGLFKRPSKGYAEETDPIPGLKEVQHKYIFSDINSPTH